MSEKQALSLLREDTTLVVWSGGTVSTCNSAAVIQILCNEKSELNDHGWKTWKENGARPAPSMHMKEVP